MQAFFQELWKASHIPPAICLAFLLTVLPMILIDRPTLVQIRQAAIPILYAGIMSSGVAYTLQIVGQRHTPPATASLIMSTEAVFALLGGILILQQIPSRRELAGCVLVFAAVILSQIGGAEEPQEKQELPEGETGNVSPENS